MHEMGVLLNIVDTVEEVARQNQVKKIHELALDVGELTGVMPQYMDACWSAVQEQYPLFAGTHLKMNVIKGRGICNECGKCYDLVEHNGVCPGCKASRYRVISGDELIIKDIAVE